MAGEPGAGERGGAAAGSAPEAPRTGRAMAALAALGLAATALQAALILRGGEAYCLNEGCRVVEGLTRSPLAFNLLGFAWFAAVLAALRLGARRAPGAPSLLAIVLLAGVGAEGLLLAFQLFAARTFCSYCLFVLGLVLLLNLLAGRRQLLAAGTVLGSAVAIASLLRFGAPPGILPAGGRALDRGTYGVRLCEAPAKQLYLIFSSTCPHCREVLRTLENCNSCNFHFNPIDRLRDFRLPGIERTPAYDPDVNRGLLALLGVDEVPVLVAVNPDGLSVIRGERRITAYIREECFRTEPLLYLDPSRYLGGREIPMFQEEDDGCRATVECEDEEGAAPPPGPPGLTPPDPFSVPRGSPPAAPPDWPPSR